MPYLDSEQKFYDYGTKKFDGKNPFDEKKTGVPFYNQFFTDPDYMEEYKNLKYNIIEISPKQYFEECAKIFDSTYQNQINQTKADKQNIEHLKEVLLKWGRTFPIVFLNYAENTQEGRHRMFVVGELLGWDKKFPVMAINWADPEKEEEKRKAQEKDKKDKIISYIDEISNTISSIEYDDVDELVEDFKYYLNLKYLNIEEIKPTRDSIYFKIDGVEHKIPIWDFNIKNVPSNYNDEDFDYEDMLLKLESYGLKNW